MSVGLAEVIRPLWAAALLGACVGESPPTEAELDPCATHAVAAVEAAADGATVVDVSIGGLVNWSYEGEDLQDATLEAFRAIFAALDESPWDTCVTYSQTGFASTNATFEACSATDATPDVSGTVHVLIDASLGGEHGVVLGTDLAATGVEIDGSRITMTAFFSWDPAPGFAMTQGLTATVDLPSGEAVSIAGDLGLDADPRCQRIDGELATVGACGTSTLSVVDFEQCLRGCPTAGGAIYYEGEDGGVEVTFDGSSVARTGPGGRFEIPLDCDE